MDLGSWCLWCACQAKFWRGGESQYDRWGSCSTSTMLLTIISPRPNIISNSTCFHAHATKFGWMLNDGVVDMHVKFHSQILVREWITIPQARNLLHHNLTIISPLPNIIAYSTCFCAHATKFGWMLDHGVIAMHAEFHRQILTREKLDICRLEHCIICFSVIQQFLTNNSILN